MQSLSIKVGARSSALSKAQVKEVYQELCRHHAHILFENTYLETTGDKDRITSLRHMGKTDFFTKEVDLLLLSRQCRLAIHSAKDLPEPLPPGLVISAITHGVDPADVLVLRPGQTIEDLPSRACIATSSLRREERVKELRKDLTFCDLRGTIPERLELLEKGQADGVVVAEAALIRLNLTHLNRIKLPGETVPYQGQLALICREDDTEILELMSCLDSRQPKPQILYLGIDLPEQQEKSLNFIHYPIIRIHPRTFHQTDIREGFQDFLSYTHLIFTSKNAVHIFFKIFSHHKYITHHLHNKEVMCVGSQTAKAFASYDTLSPLISPVETAEGMIDFLQSLPLVNPYLFWPHSALSRSVLADFFIQQKWRFRECILYDTFLNKNLRPLDLTLIDEIHFTSPSTVNAFIEKFGCLPINKRLKAIGPITQRHLMQRLNFP
ncbi:Porphobilinogen deaminase [Neochlamydia sp. TUME1]|uniref:hydroxymethylbilane synthase n=1 Tax=Neochlamydia sp. TUME1 TaxID=1478174 RepID=UPI00058319E6|nr:hydroxymethylbilane synthase [Neochlamydia sp. TUME1]KIC77208.1 Porphobilinogen deaminase [Neochlamydia sp. TUME1]